MSREGGGEDRDGNPKSSPRTDSPKKPEPAPSADRPASEVVPSLDFSRLAPSPDTAGEPAIRPRTRDTSRALTTRNRGVLDDLTKTVRGLREGTDKALETARKAREEAARARVAESVAKTELDTFRRVVTGGTPKPKAADTLDALRESIEDRKRREADLRRGLEEAHGREQRTVMGTETGARAEVEQAEGAARAELEHEKARLANLDDVDIVRPDEGLVERRNIRPTRLYDDFKFPASAPASPESPTGTSSSGSVVDGEGVANSPRLPSRDGKSTRRGGGSQPEGRGAGTSAGPARPPSSERGRQ